MLAEVVVVVARQQRKEEPPPQFAKVYFSSVTRCQPEALNPLRSVNASLSILTHKGIILGGRAYVAKDQPELPELAAIR